MRNAHGYAVLLDPGIQGGVAEFDCFRCNHCGRIRHLKPREMPFATCKSCMDHICEGCYGRLMRGEACSTIERQADELEAAIAKRRAVEAWF